MKKSPIILARPYSWNKEELEIAAKYFPVATSRVGIEDKLVIGRFSVLPFYNELQKDLRIQKSELINSLLDHQYIANFDYYHDISHATPKTYFSPQELPEAGPFFIKGKTNSKKHLGFKKTKAANKAEAIDLYFKHLEDAEYEQQGVIFRKFEELQIVEKSAINDFHFYNEWRLFFYKGQLLTYGFYWVNAENIPTNDKLPDEAIFFAKDIAKEIKEHTNFFVIDIGQKIDGSWIVIEINDGQQSGLSNCNPEELYSNLQTTLRFEGEDEY